MATITSPRPTSPAVPQITSPSPTSSIRPSLDLSSNPPIHQTNQPASTTSTDPTQRRNRAALRDYYNLKTKPSASPSLSNNNAAGGGGSGSPAPSSRGLSRTASITSTTSNFSSATLTTNADNGGGGSIQTSVLPPAIDDPTFDADAYIASLLKTSSLKDIIRAESSLVSEIRNLDGERKALVYDNYSKLIVAVGTIGEMQRGIVQGDRDGSGLARMRGLEEKLDTLMNGFEGLSGQAAGVTVGVGEDGVNKKERKSSVDERKMARDERRSKELVRWVLDAPSRLGELVESGKREEAEKEWEEVQTILEKWQGVKGVDEVRAKCNKVLEVEVEEEEAEDKDNEGD